MPATQKTYPEWVQKYRVQGTTVKKKGDAYYLPIMSNENR
jgi:hypothetical protein